MSRHGSKLVKRSKQNDVFGYGAQLVANRAIYETCVSHRIRLDSTIALLPGTQRVNRTSHRINSK